MKKSGILDKVKIKERFQDLEKNAPQLYAYAKAFYWTLMNYFMAYRSSSTGIVQGNTEAAKDKKEASIFKVIEIGMNFVESVPLVGAALKVFGNAVGTFFGEKIERRFENQTSIINFIVMEHKSEDEFDSMIAFTALDIAFKLREDGKFDFDEKKSDSVWEKMDKKFREQIDKIEAIAIGEAIDLYQGPAPAAALRDVLLLLAYLYKCGELVIAQKTKNKKPFNELFVDVIILKKYIGAIPKK